jgi:glycosyltransferase involved in cell wall biosynthesis
MILSICIPTYNRAQYLDKCLSYLLPQVNRFNNDVEVIVIDNFSTDETELIVKKYVEYYGFLKYYKNSENLGYTGNQIKCYTLPLGYYTAFLSDDDIYLNSLLDDLLPFLYLKKYSFVALNYYSFIDNVNVSLNSNFAPIKNVIFERAYDILNYPSVGHWSGFIINSELSKITLENVLKLKSLCEFERNRGLIGELVHRALAKTNDPSFFFGKQLLAVSVPANVDYDVFYHLYIDDYKFYLNLFYENYISTTDLDYRRNLILTKLKFSLITQSFKYSNDELDEIKYELDLLFNNYSSYKFGIRPLFRIVKLYPIKVVVKMIYFLYKKYF